MSSTIAEDYPLHQAVYTGDLKQVSALIRLKDIDIDQQDKYGNTPLHLAIMLGRKDCVQLLLVHGASVDSPINNGGWSSLDEAISYGDRQTIMLLLRKRREHWRQTMAKKRDHLIEVLNNMGDFYAEIKWGFNTWMPLLSSLLPWDVCRIYKRACSLRMDYSLAELAGTFRWKRGDISVLVDALQPVNSDTVRLNNDEKTYMNINHKEESNFDEEISFYLSNEITHVTTQTEKAAFVREKSGWFIKEDRTEKIGDHSADFYLLNGLVINAKKRTEHMSEEDLSKKAALLENFTKGQVPDDLVQLNHRDSLSPPPTCQLSWEEYINWPAPANRPPCLSRPVVKKKTKQQFKASVAMSKDLPLDVNRILDILEVVTPMKHFSDLDGFLKSNLPPGFPIRVEIPVFPTVTLTFSCGKFEYRDDLAKNLFTVPEDYREDAG